MAHQRIRAYNTRDVYPGATLDNDLAMVVRAGHRIFMRGQTGLDLDHRMHAPEDAGGQAEQAMRNVKALLEEAGSSLEHVCKVTTYLTDRAYREAVYNVVGRHLKGIPTVATGLIVKGLAMPEMKVELDIEAVIPDAAGHQPDAQVDGIEPGMQAAGQFRVLQRYAGIDHCHFDVPVTGFEFQRCARMYPVVGSPDSIMAEYPGDGKPKGIKGRLRQLLN